MQHQQHVESSLRCFKTCADTTKAASLKPVTGLKDLDHNSLALSRFQWVHDISQEEADEGSRYSFFKIWQ